MNFKKQAPAEPEFYQEAVVNQLHEISELLIMKHIDYGSTNLVRFGELGIMIRMFDKMERLHNLLKHGNTPQVNESIEDTIKDLVGYGVQFLLLGKGQLQLPRQQKDVIK